MPIRRREFIKLGGAGIFLASLDPRKFFASTPSLLNPLSPFYEQLASDEFPFPYDENVFECAERIYNIRRNAADSKSWVTNLNLLVKSGKTIDVTIVVADTREGLASPRETLSFTGVQGTLEAMMHGFDAPRQYYQVQYREGGGAWKALSPRNFKLPNARLQSGGQIQAVFIGDDHAFDDADAVVSADLKATKITGDFFCDFLRNLKSNASWLPSNNLANMTNALSLSKSIRQILAAEDPDVAINLGDSTGIGAEYRWQNWGLPFNNPTAATYDYIARTLWYRMRKAFSGLTPNMPTLMVLGNHDGEEGYNPAQTYAQSWRQKVFQQPDPSTYPEGGHPNGNYYALTLGADEKNRDGVQFIVLDVMGAMKAIPQKVEDWTLGPDQRQWLEGVLADDTHEWSFACQHHVLGGWPAAPEETDPRAITYGRGNLFTAKDYAGYGDVAKIEQIQLTELARTSRLRGIIYGHDHIFKTTRIGDGKTLYDLQGVCAGSPKALGEVSWWQGAYWQKHYGSYTKMPPDFYGPSGYTRLTVTKDQAKYDFIPTYRAIDTNIPAASPFNVVLASAVLANPTPLIGADKVSFVFQAGTMTPSVPGETLQIRNVGGGSLKFTAKPVQSWLSVSPSSGTSAGGGVDLEISLSSKDLGVGTYDGTISIECPAAANSPFLVPVQLVVQDAPLPPPNDFKAVRLGGVYALAGGDAIRFAWKESRLAAATVKLRLSQVDDKGGRTTIGEVKPGVGAFVYKKVRRDTAYRFAICAVDAKNREGSPAYVTVPKAV
jgi:predicted phosphodiesterase